MIAFAQYDTFPLLHDTVNSKQFPCLSLPPTIQSVVAGVRHTVQLPVKLSEADCLVWLTERLKHFIYIMVGA